jgi:alanyl-tRNA synthetase
LCGSAGGRADLAQAGGQNADQIPEALEAAAGAVESGLAKP